MLLYNPIRVHLVWVKLKAQHEQPSKRGLTKLILKDKQHILSSLIPLKQTDQIVVYAA